MRASTGFVIGVLFGLGVAAAAAQNNRLGGVNNMNHVGIAVERFDEALAFYTQKMGFREAFVYRGANGEAQLAYMQVSRNSFVELQPAAPDRLPGISHFGLHVENIRTTLARLAQRGVKVEEPRTGRTNSTIANVTGPDGIRIELSELGPESLQRKAMNSWK